MTQDTHHSEHDTNSSEIKKSKTSFFASFWFVIIVVGLFISALNFISIESKTPSEGKTTEAAAHVTTHEDATVNTSAKEQTNQEKATTDSAVKATESTDASKH